MLCLPVTHISTFQLPVDVIASLTPVSMCLLSPSLVVQLARDLQTDFYPHFSDFFILITSLLDTKDTELLEWAFTCLSYLYKYLWRLMVKDMSNIYRWKMKERSHHSSIDFSKLNFTPTVYTARFWHTRRSTSASLQQRVFRFWWGRWETTKVKVNRCLPFSRLKDNRVPPYVLQVSDIDALLSHMFTDLEQHPEKAEGAGQLLFEMCKGVRHMFHSCAANVSSFRAS